MENKQIRLTPTLYWRFYSWWLRLTGRSTVVTGAIFSGGKLHVALYYDLPGGDYIERIGIAVTAMNKEQARHFLSELTREMERFEAFG